MRFQRMRFLKRNETSVVKRDFVVLEHLKRNETSVVKRDFKRFIVFF